MVDYIVVLSPGFRDRLLFRKVDKEKVTVIYNWTVLTHIPNVINKELIPKSNEKFTILFAGTMGRAQSLDTVLRAAEILQNEEYLNIQFVFIGGGICVEELKEMANSMKLENVRFLNRVTADKIAAYLLAADVLLVHLLDDPLFKITIPSKTQAYMQVGRPVLMAVGGDANSLVNEAKAGLCCPPQNPEALAKTVIQFSLMPKSELQKMGERGQIFYNEKLSIEKGSNRFMEIFKKIANV